jgi:hypothetical protein
MFNNFDYCQISNNQNYNNGLVDGYLIGFTLVSIILLIIELIIVYSDKYMNDNKKVNQVKEVNESNSTEYSESKEKSE